MNASAPTDGQHQNGEEDSGNYRQHHHHKHHPKHVSLEKVKASKEKEADPLATAREVFYFIPSIKVKIMIALGIICACVSGAVFPALAFFFSTSFEDLSAATDSDEYLKTIRDMAFSFMILGTVAFVFMTLQTLLLELSATEMTENLKKQWFQALIRQDMAYYDLRDVSGTATIISTNGQKFKKGTGKKLADGVMFGVTTILGMAYGFWSSWQVSLLVLTVVPFMALSTMFLVKIVSTQTSRANSSYAKAGSVAYMTISSIRTILSLNAVESMVVKYMGATQEAYDGATRNGMQLGLGNAFIFSSGLLAYIPVTLYGGYLLYENVIETGCDPSGASLTNETCEPVSAVGVFGALFGITIGGSVLPQVSVAIEAFTGARSAAYPALEAIYRNTTNDEGKATEREEKSQALQRRGSSAPLPKYSIDSSSLDGLKPDQVHGNIRFEDVHFSYPSRMEVSVFDGLFLDVPSGKTVALVGPSGGGKSTTVHLIERFYDPQHGSITLDGKDLRSLNIKWLRDQIGLVSQEPVLFATSIRDNIAIGCPGSTQEQIEKAAKKANAHDFIMSFPQGYDTQVGDKGAQLSGGQKQRVALARVLITKPAILLLDEATSALDSESEAVVQEALDILMEEGNQTIVVIAHRLSTIKNADIIAVVSEGKVVETGTHKDLMEKQGAYYDLVEAQQGSKKGEEDTTTSTASSETTSRASSAVEEEIEVAATAAILLENGSNHVLRFHDVHFHYPSRPMNKVFRGLDLCVEEGETLAIVGPSGQGKSTIIQLIENFYRPTKGTIEYRGVDMKDLNVRWLREQMSLVSQEPILFDCSIGENIRFGCPSATQDDIEWAAREANAHDFILSFPDKYNTEVGAGSSSQVSGGQKQRIAIARALLRKPKVLLLDEATSALDSESEKVVQEALDKIMVDKTQTTIVIAHRLSTIRNADRIAVIDHGKVREIGTHEELMSNLDGKYRHLQALQNLDSKVESSDKTKVQESTLSPTKEDHVESKDEEEEVKKERGRKYAQRARLLAKGDGYYLFIGALGAVLAGLVFPAWGFIFAFMVEMLYYPIEQCDDDLDQPIAYFPEFENCQDYWDDAADFMQDLSFKVFYGLCGVIAASIIGNVLLHYGFGTATERMNKRVRDSAFKNLIRQEVAWFDVRPVGTLTTQLSDDAAMIHSFSGQPIRMLIMNISSVVVGLVVSFIYMWPFALLTISILPFMSIGKAVEIQVMMGDEKEIPKDLPADSSGGIVIEALLNIRTVASLTIEEQRMTEFESALRREDPQPIRTNIVKGSAGGLAQIVQMWGIALMFWWGGWLLYRFPSTYTFRDMLVSLFGMMFGFTGLGIAMQDLTDSEKAKAAANRIFELIDRVSEIDPLSDEGKKL